MPRLLLSYLGEDMKSHLVSVDIFVADLSAETLQLGFTEDGFIVKPLTWTTKTPLLALMNEYRWWSTGVHI